MTQKPICFIRPHINHKGEGKNFWGLIMKHGWGFQCFTYNETWRGISVCYFVLAGKDEQGKGVYIL